MKMPSYTSLLLMVSLHHHAARAWSPRKASPLRMSITTVEEAANSASIGNNNKTKKLSRTGHDQEAWERGYTTCPVEIAPTTLDVPDLPDDFPAGTYFRNGHARFESDDGSVRVQHMFDGDGMITAHTFCPRTKRMLFRNRFVQTAGYRADKLTGKMTAPGTFGTRVSGGFLKNLGRTDFKNVANTHVLHANNKLFALWEGGWPHTVDPYTLENDFVAEPDGCNMNGLLNEGDAFAAHYRYDPVQHTYCGFGIKLNPTAGTTKIKLYELDGDTLESTRTDDEVSVVYPGTGLTHDYALTQNWYVFSLPPAKINNVAALKALFGLGAFSGVIDFQNDAETAKIVLIPRMKHLRHGTATDMNVDNDNRIKVVEVPYHFSFHCANAFEDENGQVLLDMVLMNKGVIGSDLPRDRPVWESVDWETTVTSAKYVRFQVDPIQERMTAEPKVMTTRAPEFPIIPKQLSTRKHRYAYTVASHKEFEVRETGSGPAGAIMKIDTERPENNEVLAFEPHEFVGEPAFVPKVGVDVTNPTDEDKGYLVVHVLNGINLTTDLVILDVEGRGKLEAGPVTRIRLPTFVPHGLHGIFDGVSFDF